MTEPHPPAPPKARPTLLYALLITAAAVIIALTIALVTLTIGEDALKATPRPSSTPTSTPSAPTVTARGTVTMKRYDDDADLTYRVANWHEQGPVGCEGAGGYDDMAEGVNVSIYSQSSSIVAVGTLGHGVRIGELCSWPFEVTGVPDLPFYQVEVSHRGQVAVQRANIASVGLSLG